MAMGFTKRNTFKECRKTYYNRYVLKVKEPLGEPALIGIEAGKMLDTVVARRMAGEITKPSQIVPLLKTLVTDVVDEDGVVTSTQTSARFVIEKGIPSVKKVLHALAGADQVLSEEPVYFDEDWNPIEQEPGEKIWQFKNRAVHGGDIDLSAIHGDVASVLDWKSGNMKYSKPQQVEEYQAYYLMTYDGLTRVRGGLVWLKHNEIQEVPDLYPGDVQRVVEMVEQETREIEEATDFDCDGCYMCRNAA